VIICEIIVHLLVIVRNNNVSKITSNITFLSTVHQVKPTIVIYVKITYIVFISKLLHVSISLKLSSRTVRVQDSSNFRKILCIHGVYVCVCVCVCVCALKTIGKVLLLTGDVLHLQGIFFVSINHKKHR